MVQANRWLQGHPSVTLSPLTSTLIEAALGELIGVLEPAAMADLDLALRG